MARILVFLFIATRLALAADLEKTFKKAQVQVGSKKIQAYLADDEEKRTRGLMFVEKLPENTGMLFVFENEQPLAFWMKNTLIPLNIGYFDRKGVLVDTKEMAVLETLMQASPPTYQSRAPAQFALEMPKGWFKKNKINEGARLRNLSTSPSQLLNKILPPGK